MCDRFTWTNQNVRRIKADMGIGRSLLAARYNIAPGRVAPIIRLDENGLTIADEYTWGLVPSWVKGTVTPGITAVRVEDAGHSNLIHSLLRRQRCLILADGYFEWIREVKPRQPVRFVMRNGLPMVFAGVWDTHLAPDGTSEGTFAMLTTTANDLVGQITNRMPVILRPQDWHAWLDPLTFDVSVQEMFRPLPAEEMDSYRVTPRVNNPFFNDPSSIQKFMGRADSFPGMEVYQRDERRLNVQVRYAESAGKVGDPSVEHFETISTARRELRKRGYVCIEGNFARNEKETWYRLTCERTGATTATIFPLSSSPQAPAEWRSPPSVALAHS